MLYRILALVSGLVVGAPAVALAASNPDPLLSTPDFGGTTFPIGNYGWDPASFWGSFNPIYSVSDAVFTLSTFIVRFSMWILNLGFAPSGWLSPMQKIADAIQSSHMIEHVWPFFFLVAAAVLIKDLFRFNPQRLMQRATVLGLAMGALIVFQAIGTTRYLTVATNAIDTVSYAITGWVMSADQPNTSNATSGQGFQKANKTVDQGIWEMLVQTPWELGELGTTNQTIDPKDVDTVKTALSTANQSWFSSLFIQTFNVQNGKVQNIASNTLWRDVLLPFPVDNGPRKELVCILTDDQHPTSKTAFDPGYRMILSIVSTVAALGAGAFLVVVGGVLLVAHLLYLVAIVSAIFILPVSLLPWSYSESMLRWWIRTLTGSVFIKLALSAYVGATFLVSSILSVGGVSSTGSPSQSQIDAGMGGSIAEMLLYPVWFILSLFLLRYIQKHWKPFERVTDHLARRALGMRSDVGFADAIKQRFNPEHHSNETKSERDVRVDHSDASPRSRANPEERISDTDWSELKQRSYDRPKSSQVVPRGPQESGEAPAEAHIDRLGEIIESDDRFIRLDPDRPVSAVASFQETRSCPRCGRPLQTGDYCEACTAELEVASVVEQVPPSIVSADDSPSSERSSPETTERQGEHVPSESGVDPLQGNNVLSIVADEAGGSLGHSSDESAVKFTAQSLEAEPENVSSDPPRRRLMVPPRLSDTPRERIDPDRDTPTVATADLPTNDNNI